MMVLVIWLSLSPLQAKCGLEEDTYDEISLILNVQRVGSTEIPAVIFRQEAYLPVKEIFDFLKIRNTISTDLDQISGFIINPETSFIIDKFRNQITYAGHTYPLSPGDLIQTETNLYLKSNYFGEVFGLVCTFNFRSLSVALTTKIELPIIREMQQELIRKNISKLRGEKKADTLIERKFSLLKAGVADWAVISSQQSNAPTSTRVTLNLGGTVLGGEASLYLNHTIGQPFDIKAQSYNWRYVNNKNRVIRQINIGRVAPTSTTPVFAPINGIQISNTPTSGRRSYGTYTLSNKTEPGWTVELYINNVLVNFMKADASGFYSFEIPMVYGSSEVKLRFYGPWGEERVSEQFINIPFNLIPLRQFEYSASGGIVADDAKSRFASAKFGFGLSRRFTFGGGVDYLSSANNGNPIPYLTASTRLGSRIMISAEKMYGVKSEGTVSYRSPLRLQVDFMYTKYNIGQTVIKNNFIEEKKLILSKSFRVKKYSGFTRLSITDYTLIKSKITRAEILTSVIKGRVNTNLTTYAILSNNKLATYSNLSVSFYLPGGIRFSSQTQFDYQQKNFGMYQASVEKTIFKRAHINVSYQNNLASKSQAFNLGLRYNFSFAQAYFGGSYANNTITATQSVRGSLLYDNTTGYLGTSNQGQVGRGGVIVVPFLDLNCNGERDEDEPRVDGLHFKVNGGRIENNKKDTSIRVVGMQAYNTYFIELDKNSFDNVAWQIRNKIIGVEIEPNQFKLVEVPIAVLGEVTGSVALKQGGAINGIGRIIVIIKNARTGKIVVRILTEADGYFSYLGLAPGKYTASVDPAQLKNLKMDLINNNLPFNIKSNREGDIAEGLQFEITKPDEPK
jgi:hypothetical protein